MARRDERHVAIATYAVWCRLERRLTGKKRRSAGDAARHSRKWCVSLGVIAPYPWEVKK